MVVEHPYLSFYPSIGYSERMMHCGFNFTLNYAKLFDIEQGMVKKKSGDYTREDLIEMSRIQEENEEKAMSLFPFEQLTQPYDFVDLLNDFTDIDETVSHIPMKTDEYGLLIASSGMVFATQLKFDFEFGRLKCHMHNGGHAPIGLTMTAYGLRALKTIYGAYSVSTEELPEISFEGKDMKLHVPLASPNMKNTIEIDGIKPVLSENSLDALIPYAVGDGKTRSTIAFSLLDEMNSLAFNSFFQYEKDAKTN